MVDLYHFWTGNTLILTWDHTQVNRFILSLLPKLGTMGSKWGGVRETGSSTSSASLPLPPLGKSKLDGKEEEIQLLLKKEVGITSIAKIMEVSRTALRHFIKTRKLSWNRMPHFLRSGYANLSNMSPKRDIVYGKRGHMTKRDFHEIMKTCGCLTLILACIIYWQAKEIGRVVSKCNPEAEGIDISLLEHISPIEWSNVLLYGEYVIDPSLIQ
jgi:Tn3 transposase DDE domain-containing protein